MSPNPGGPATRDAAMPDQDAMNRRSRRHMVGWVIVEQELVELAGPPAPHLPELEDLANHRRVGGAEESPQLMREPLGRRTERRALRLF
jgi:hypothetical protein